MPVNCQESRFQESPHETLKPTLIAAHLLLLRRERATVGVFWTLSWFRNGILMRFPSNLSSGQIMHESHVEGAWSSIPKPCCAAHPSTAYRQVLHGRQQVVQL